MTSSRPRKRFRFKAPHRTPRPLTKEKLSSPSPQSTRSSSPVSQSSSPMVDKTSETSPQASGQRPTSSKPTKTASASAAFEKDEDEDFSTALFEALSSPEHAVYWAAIYGQPLHIYPRPNVGNRAASDAEYTAYVQRRVWENTRQGIEETARVRKRVRAAEERVKTREEREERQRARRMRKEEMERMREKEREADEREDEVWNVAARAYIHAWSEVKDGIPWPWLNGNDSEDWEMRFNAEDIETFIRHVADLQEVSLEQQLRIERVRWHPDKIVQRFAGDGNAVTDAIMSRVNEVWRVVDALWKDAGGKKRTK